MLFPHRKVLNVTMLQCNNVAKSAFTHFFLAFTDFNTPQPLLFGSVAEMLYLCTRKRRPTDLPHALSGNCRD